MPCYALGTWPGKAAPLWRGRMRGLVAGGA